MNKLFRVELPSATFGFETEDGKVSKAAPIIQNLFNRDEDAALQFLFNSFEGSIRICQLVDGKEVEVSSVQYGRDDFLDTFYPRDQYLPAFNKVLEGIKTFRDGLGDGMDNLLAWEISTHIMGELQKYTTRRG